MTTYDKPHREGTPSWADLVTDDPAGARQFYGSLFDWTFDVGGPESGHYTMCNVGGKPVAGIGAKPPGAPFPTAWTMYLATGDVARTCAKATELGGAVVMPPMQVMDAGTMAIVSDPTGGVFGLWQSGRHIGAERMAEPGAFAWTELNTRDLARAQAFLSGLFGYTTQDVPIPTSKYVTLHLGDETAGGILQMNEHWPAEIPPHWMVYFQCDDTDAAVEKAKGLGATCHVAPFDTPYGRIAVIGDPQGATFSLVRPPR